jgi:hypothetical protein
LPHRAERVICKPHIPLAVALPRMLEKIEADLSTAGLSEERRPSPASRFDPRAAHMGGAITYPVVT